MLVFVFGISSLFWYFMLFLLLCTQLPLWGQIELFVVSLHTWNTASGQVKLALYGQNLQGEQHSNKVNSHPSCPLPCHCVVVSLSANGFSGEPLVYFKGQAIKNKRETCEVEFIKTHHHLLSILLVNITVVLFSIGDLHLLISLGKPKYKE